MSTGIGSPEVSHEVKGPSIEAWADEYIRFDNLPDWQKRLRREIVKRCRQLDPSADEVLHAMFFGQKPPKADIENLLLYNIGSFGRASRNGIRFEHASGSLPAQDGVEYQFGYRYSLAPRSSSFTYWQPRRTLASFDWIDIEGFKADKALAPVWLALARGEADKLADATPDTPFAVRVEVYSPGRSQDSTSSELVKGFIDGIVCGFQAHTDMSVLPDVANRIAARLPAEADEIEQLLTAQHKAVLGSVRRLVAPYGDGVKWDPCDHLCLAGEFRWAESAPPGDGSRWAFKGEVIELSRSQVDPHPG